MPGHRAVDPLPARCHAHSLPGHGGPVADERAGCQPTSPTVTYTLQDGIVWSDGEPLTAEDVVFTWEWIIDPANQSSNAALYEAIASVDAVDDLTVKITFKEPQLGWNSYFSSAQSGGILPRAHPLGGERCGEPPSR